MTIERRRGPRVIRGTQAVLRITLYQDGDAANADALPTVTITRLDGTAIVTASPSTKPAATTGIYEFTLTPAMTALVDELSVVWTFAVSAVTQTLTTYASVVGDTLFTLNQARRFEAPALADETRYPDATILEARDRIQDAFEDILGFALGTRASIETLSGNYLTGLYVPDRYVSAVRAGSYRSAGAWAAFTTPEVTDVLAGSTGLLIRETLGYWPLGSNNVRVLYEHGLQPVPYELQLAGLRVLRDEIVVSALPDRATSMSTPEGVFSIRTPGVRGSFYGLPLVDEVLERHRAKTVGIA